MFIDSFHIFRPVFELETGCCYPIESCLSRGSVRDYRITVPEFDESRSLAVWSMQFHSQMIRICTSG